MTSEKSMRSIPVAITWEMLQRGKWAFPAALLGAAAPRGRVWGACGLTGPSIPEIPPSSTCT